MAAGDLVMFRQQHLGHDHLLSEETTRGEQKVRKGLQLLLKRHQMRP